MATRKRKKTVRRRTSATRRGKPKPLPPWALLGVGLIVGLLVAGLAQVVINRTNSPDSGLRKLVHRAQKAEPKPARKPQAAQPKTHATKAHFDFYTILPEVETVLPPTVGGRPGESTRPEQNVHYVLQAGSFNKFDDADQLKARLALNGLTAHIQKVSIEGKGEFHRVRLGPYKRLEDLDKHSRRLEQLGIPALRLKVTGKIKG